MILMCGWKTSGVWLEKRTWRKESASSFMLEEVHLSVREYTMPMEKINLHERAIIKVLKVSKTLQYTTAKTVPY